MSNKVIIMRFVLTGMSNSYSLIKSGSPADANIPTMLSNLLRSSLAMSKVCGVSSTSLQSKDTRLKEKIVKSRIILQNLLSGNNIFL